MKFRFLIILLLNYASVFAQKQYKVLDWKSEYTLNTFLLQEMDKQYDMRRVNLTNALSSESELRAYRDSSRVRYRRLIGNFPKKEMLNAQRMGVVERENYRVEKIVYESLPKHHVTGNLYIPEGNGPFPAVLLFCGHETEAKATESYQKTAILFALNGFVVFVVDPISQGERFQLLSKNGIPLTRGGTTEHTLINAAANLVGSSAVAYELWDNIRALDFLETRKEVDRDRIGCLGNSGGATQVTYLIGFDERIKVAAACSFIASRERNFELTGANDGCQHIPGEGLQQLEISDFLIMFSPKPLLILAGKYDFVDYKGTLNAFDELQKVYLVSQKRSQLKLFTAEDGHGISAPKREASVNWFRQWLTPKSGLVKEASVITLSQDALQCTATGQVNSFYAGEVDDIERSRELADAFVTDRSKSQKDLVSRLKIALDLKPNRNYVITEEVGVVRVRQNTFHKIILRKEGNIPVPILEVRPHHSNEVVVWLHEKGKHTIADSTELVNHYLQQNKALILADLTGIGETADPYLFNDPKYYNSEYRNAMLALHTGRSLTSLRTTDIITVLDYIKSKADLSEKPVYLVAGGKTSLGALHAAVLDNRINQVEISNGLHSFYEIFDNPSRRDWYSYVIPGVLKHYDLPELRQLLGERLKNSEK
jgi:cephalosporin-C deacetylase-like acetyl esterase